MTKLLYEKFLIIFLKNQNEYLSQAKINNTIKSCSNARVVIPIIQEVEAERTLTSAWTTQRVPGQPGQLSEALTQTRKQIEGCG